MRRFLSGLFFGSGLLLLTSGASAQFRFPADSRDQGYFRDDPYDRDDGDWRYSRQGPDQYGYGRYGRGRALIDDVISDLDRAASRSRVDGHEEKHFNKAVEELQKFQQNQYKGKFDEHSLEKAMDNMQHLAGARQLRPRDRDMIAGDLRALSDLRANRGRMYRNRFPNDDGYREDGRYGRYDPYGYGR